VGAVVILNLLVRKQESQTGPESQSTSHNSLLSSTDSKGRQKFRLVPLQMRNWSRLLLRWYCQATSSNRCQGSKAGRDGKVLGSQPGGQADRSQLLSKTSTKLWTQRLVD
jgi:hypothetical protein